MQLSAHFSVLLMKIQAVKGFRTYSQTMLSGSRTVYNCIMVSCLIIAAEGYTKGLKIYLASDVQVFHMRIISRIHQNVNLFKWKLFTGTLRRQS